MVFFSKLNDSADDLFSNGYKSLGAFSLKSKSKTNNGTKLEFNGKKKNGKDTVTGGVKFVESFKNDDLTVDLTGQLNEEGTLTDSIDLSGFADGVKVTVEGILKTTVETDKECDQDAEKESKITRNQISGKISYSNDKVGLNFGLTQKVLNSPVLDFDIAGVVTDNVSVGAKVKVPLKKVESGKVCDTDFTLKLSTDDVVILMNLTEAGEKAAVAMVHSVNDKLTVGTEFTNKGFALPWCFKKTTTEESKETTEESKKSRNWGITLGATYKTDSNATLNAKLNDKGVATASYDFELKENLRANFAAETNISALGQETKLGLSLTYSN